MLVPRPSEGSRTLLKSVARECLGGSPRKYSTQNPMIPEASDPNQSDDRRREISPTELFTAFAHDRRQRVVAYLAQKPVPTPVGDIAEYVAIAEGEPTYDRYERVLTALAHGHLPALQEAGLVRYDPAAETAELVVSRSVVAPYLKLAGHADA